LITHGFERLAELGLRGGALAAELQADELLLIGLKGLFERRQTAGFANLWRRLDARDDLPSSTEWLRRRMAERERK
jgi:hypothetical protein